MRLKKPTAAAVLAMMSLTGLNPVAWAGAPTTEQRLERISAELDTATAYSKNQLKRGGTVLLAMGLASTAAGTYMLIRNGSDPAASSTDFANVPATALGAGIAFSLVGGLALMEYSSADSDWRKPLKLSPETKPEDRLQAYEELFKTHATTETNRRHGAAVVDFVLTGATGIAYFASDRTPSNQTWLFLSAISLGAGITSLVTRGYYEESWDRYQAWSKGDAASVERHAYHFEAEPTLVAQKDGPGMGLTLRW